MLLFKDLMWFFKLEKKSYITGIIVLVLVAFLNLFPPYVVRVIVDEVTRGVLTPRSLLQWTLLLIGNGVAVYALRFTWRLMIFGAASRLSKVLRKRLFDHFTLMSPQFYQKYRTGDLMAHATNDIQAIEMTAGMGVLTFVDSLTTGGLVIISMAVFISWKLTLITLLPMPIMAWATSRYGTMLHKRFHRAQAAFSDLNDKVLENINGVRVVKAFGEEKAELEAFRKLSEDVVEKNLEVAKVDALFDPTIQLIIGISFFLALIFGSIDVINDRLTFGQLTQFTIYLGQFIWPMLAFGWLFNILERGRASYDRVDTLLKIDQKIMEKENALSRFNNGDVIFEKASFSYPGVSTSVLRNISVRVRQGQTLGIVGKTGSGKTTFLRLLLREFDLSGGALQIGGISVYDVTLESLRGKIGYVPQDHFLFSTSIAENIALGKPAASLEEIHDAAAIADIHNDVLSFPEGYDTLVGDRGVTLSGGQKQRISIARALLLEPEILILDDSLSAVDAKTEKSILQSLRKMRVQKTTFISSHRLSAVEEADLIIVLKDGQISEEGSHSELMALNGWYASTYRSQQLESLIEEGGEL
ncbi:ABC-type multidrug transport system, ATPase and permease component [Desulfosporosinus acidiphilus SJ4]|uniref:ABC-type multidrug transport system, ATPase and permease component n=1 Tax=Desulfosporosinus acidiphilus (strain DSM 22704 / JCM 16185 / SJ4) TaxID=646529 RepID=I4D6C7_DESAJ|nr:ABC transporter transmembrane domain-containing protein [Desulfosporosinus acidiphilus]AFM41351.1 ABC-type multidrug transport system, ATPase and permease component [Desulfosporosinus acidiphilus SJ4]